MPALLEGEDGCDVVCIREQVELNRVVSRTADFPQSAIDDTGQTERSDAVKLCHGRKLDLPHRSRGVGGDGKIGDSNHLLPVDDPLGVDDHGDEHTVA